MNDAALLRLLTWLSPAFPTGGFAYSHGLEWSVEAGDVTDPAALTDWLQDLLAHGALWSDVILLRHAHRGGEVARLAELGTALAPCAERQLETLAQGAAFAAAAAAWPAPELQNWGAAALPYPAGLRVQAALEPAIIAAAAATRTATLDDLGTAGWAAEIAAMRHETQFTRLFRT
jgi:urease accessory protein